MEDPAGVWTPDLLSLTHTPNYLSYTQVARLAFFYVLQRDFILF